MSEGIIGGRKNRLTKKSAVALAIVVVVTLSFYFVLHRIHLEAMSHPSVLVALPFVAISWLALMMPLFFYIAYHKDFRHLSPWIPTHYFQLARRTFTTITQNNFKVSEKDL